MSIARPLDQADPRALKGLLVTPPRGHSSNAASRAVSDVVVAHALWATTNAILSLAWRNDRLRTDPVTALPIYTDIVTNGLAPRT